jgi:electron-transferring-flavoprotein dehydrogenase
MWCNTLFGGWSPFGTMRHGKPDYASLEPAAGFVPIDYPRPDGELTFDRLSSVFLSNTNHSEDQPAHLHVASMDLQKSSELGVYAGPSARFCPAGVYEWVDGNGNAITGTSTEDARFVINFQNCVHCKTCDIKDPNQNINWVPPQGGEGPVYPNM